MTAEREALEAYGRFVDAVAQEFAEKGLEQARAIFAFHLRAVSQALANPATIRDTEEDAVEADMRAYAEAAMQHGWKTAVDAAANGRLVDLYARDWFEKNPPKCARLASSTPAEPREASGYCPFCMTADPVAPAEPDEPSEAMKALSLADQALTFYRMEAPLPCQTPLTERALKAVRAALSQRKAKPDVSGERKC